MPFFLLRLGLNKHLHDSVIDLHDEILNTCEYAVESFVLVSYEHFVHLLLTFFNLILTISLCFVNGFGQTVISVTEILREAVNNLKIFCEQTVRVIFENKIPEICPSEPSSMPYVKFIQIRSFRPSLRHAIPFYLFRLLSQDVQEAFR